MVGVRRIETVGRAALAAAAGALAGLPAIGRAQTGTDWPNQPVRYINIFPPGGATDTLSRLYCAKMSEITGQQFVVENRSGSGGVVGTDAIAKSRPDGYTIGLGSIAPHAIAPTLYANLPYRCGEGLHLRFRPLAAAEPGGGQQRPAGAQRAGADRAAEGQSRQIRLWLLRRRDHAASLGRVAEADGRDRTSCTCPTAAAPRRCSTCMAGRVQLIMDNIPGLLPAARDGKIRALAVTGPQRSPVVPDLPTMAEFLPGFEMTSWGAVCGPAGMPRPVVERLSAFSKRALENPDLVRGYQELGATPWWTTPEDIAPSAPARKPGWRR